MRIKSIWLRRIHKWIGLVIGLQFLIWAISGATMALLDMETVAGGPKAELPAAALPTSTQAWSEVSKALAGEHITRLTIRTLPQGAVFAATTSEGVRLFDAVDGKPAQVDKGVATSVAVAAHPDRAAVTRVVPMNELDLAVREHELPIWRVDFGDEINSSYYVSGTTGEVLERRNDTWRLWDFVWMLHNMDYAERTSFNHPLIITVGFAMAWLAVTGFWLLFRTMWRHDFVAIRRLTKSGTRSRPRSS